MEIREETFYRMGALLEEMYALYHQEIGRNESKKERQAKLMMSFKLLTGNTDNLINKENVLISQQTKGDIETMYKQKEKGTTIVQRCDGRWEARITINGKQKTIKCSKDKNKVIKELNKTIKELRTNKGKINLGQKQKYTLYTWLDKWLEIYRKPKVQKGELSTSSYENDRHIINRIKKEFKNIDISKLNNNYIQEVLNEITQTRTAVSIYQLLKMALLKANIRIMDLVDKPKHTRVNGRSLTKDEINLIHGCCKNQLEHDIFTLYENLGCRPAEVVRIKKEHIKFNENKIFIDGTKNKPSKRWIPIMPDILDILKRLTETDNEYIIDKSFNVIEKIYKRIKPQLNFKWTLKDFRHTFATRCKDKGIPVDIYSKWLGHSGTEMATRIYTHETEKDNEISQEWAKNF